MKKIIIFLVLLFSLISIGLSRAKDYVSSKVEYFVTSSSELQDLESSLRDGDVVTLAGHGDFTNLVFETNLDNFTIKGENTTVITGNSQIELTGSHSTVENLIFTNGEPYDDKGAIVLRGSYNQALRIEIDDYNGTLKKWVSLYGNNHTVSNSSFLNKSTEGALLTVWRPNTDANYHMIENNYFYNFESGNGANGYETIRLGDSEFSQSDSYTTIRNNLFESMDGEIEMISIKSGRNTISGNTIINSEGLITSRHGTFNTIENNVIIQGFKSSTGGIRVYDEGHVVNNNYISGVNTTSNTRGGIVIHSGVNKPGDTAVINAQWTAFNIDVTNNTIVDSRQSMVHDGKYDYAPEDIRFDSNVIFTSDYEAVREDKTIINASYTDEHYFGTSLGMSSQDGINFGHIELVDVDGFLTHSDGYGASGLTKLTSNDVGRIDNDNGSGDGGDNGHNNQIDASKDTFVDITQPDSNFGTSGFMYVKTHSSLTQGRIAYTLFDFGSNYVDEFTYRFYVDVRGNNSSSAPNYKQAIFDVFLLSDMQDFNEDLLNWNNSPYHKDNTVEIDYTQGSGINKVGNFDFSSINIVDQTDVGVWFDINVKLDTAITGSFTLMLFESTTINPNANFRTREHSNSPSILF